MHWYVRGVFPNARNILNQHLKVTTESFKSQHQINFFGRKEDNWSEPQNKSKNRCHDQLDKNLLDNQNIDGHFALIGLLHYLSLSLSLPPSLSLSSVLTLLLFICSVRACCKLLFFLGTLLALALLHFLVWQFLYFTPLSLFLSQSISPSPFGCLLAFVLVFTLIKKQHWLETFHGLLSSSSKNTPLE